MNKQKNNAFCELVVDEQQGSMIADKLSCNIY